MIELGVNIDHVATIRQARRTWEPDPVAAAIEAQLGGADGITVHLREDRRHIQDDDVRRIRTELQVKLNFEMAATEEMIAFARQIKPKMAMLVPEGRMEITTEGGLDVDRARRHVTETVASLRDVGIVVSAFIDPELRQVEAAAACGIQVCEVHTGPYAHAFHRHEGDLDCPDLRETLAAVARGRGGYCSRGYAVQCWPCAQLPECSARCRAAWSARTAYWAFNRESSCLRGDARGGWGNDLSDPGSRGYWW